MNKQADTVTFDRRKFVLAWMASADLAHIPAPFSGAQLRYFETIFGVTFNDVVDTITQEEFEAAFAEARQANIDREKGGYN